MYKLEHKNIAYRVAVSSLFFNQGLTFSSWATRIPDFKNNLNMDEASLGSLLLALPAGQIMAMVLSGYLVSKYTSKKVLNLVGFLYPAMLFVLLLANSFTTLFLCLCLFGMVANLSNIAINTQAVDVERIYGRSVMASFHGLWSLAGFCGGIISAIFVGYSIDLFYHYIFINMVTSIIFMCAMNYLVLTDFPPEADSESSTEKPRGFFRPTMFIVLLGVVAFCSFSCEGAMFDWSVIFFRDVIGLAPDISRLGFIVYTCAMSAGRFISDYFINRFGHIFILKFSGVLMSLGMFIAIYNPNIYVSTLGFLLVGFGVSPVVPSAFGLAGKSRRMNSSVAISVVATIGFFGFLLFPPIIGYIAEFFSLRASFAVMAVIGFFVSLIAPILSKHIKEISK